MKKLFALVGLVVAAQASPRQCYNIITGNFDCGDSADFLRQKTSKIYSECLPTAEVFYTDPYGYGPTVLPERFLLDGDQVNLLVGDFNGDGKDDILRQEHGCLDNDNKHTASVLLSCKCEAKFKKFDIPECFKLSGDVANLFVGDFNGDGKDDILRQDKGCGAAVILYAKGIGEWEAVTLCDSFKLGAEDAVLHIGDFDGDGRDDILRQDKDCDTATIFYGTCDKSFDKVDLKDCYKLSAKDVNLYVGDFNGDGRDDILRQVNDCNEHDKIGTASILYATCERCEFDLVVLCDDFKLAADKVNLHIGDFNGDGKDDILRQEKGCFDHDKRDNGSLLLANCDKNFDKVDLCESLDIGGDKVLLYIDDFNGDGKSDFLKYWGCDLTVIYLSDGHGKFTTL